MSSTFDGPVILTVLPGGLPDQGLSMVQPLHLHSHHASAPISCEEFAQNLAEEHRATATRGFKKR